MTPEAKVKNAAKKLLTDAGAYFFMPFGGGYGRAGIPDIVACVNGRFVGIECKAADGKTTALQNRELDAIDAAGGHTLVFRGTEKDYVRLQGLIDRWKATPCPS